MSFRMMGSSVEASRARGCAIRAAQHHNGQRQWQMEEMIKSRERKRTPYWPATFDPQDYPEKTLEELISG